MTVKTVPRQLKLNGKQVQCMPGHELNQSYRLQLRLQDMSEIHLNQSGHVACSTCSTINMRKYFGIQPESIKTVPRQLKLGGKLSKRFQRTHSVLLLCCLKLWTKAVLSSDLPYFRNIIFLWRVMAETSPKINPVNRPKREHHHMKRIP